jgi:hypothetical protein
LKRKLLLSILAVVAVASMPLTATSQKFHIFHRHGAAPAAVQPASANKYEVFAGLGYTSLNNVNQSRNGLMGVSVSVTRDWGRFFGITADGGYYQFPYNSTNPGNPTVEMLMFGPVVHAHLAGRVDGFAHALLGGEHISGDSARPGFAFSTPNISFAGGPGAGLDYKLSPHFSMRLSGDSIISSFAANTDTGACAPPNGNCSAHKTRSARASFGLVYKF